MAALAEELTRVRRRGLDGIDLDTKSRPRVPAPLLEALARQYCRDRATGRIVLIRRLLDEALTAWAAAGHRNDARFVRRLFFALADGTPGKQTAGQLLQNVRDELELEDKRVDELRRTNFEAFAAFLIDFVEQRSPQRRWLLVGLGVGGAAVVTGSVLAVIHIVSGGSPAAPTLTAQFRFDGLGGGSQTIDVYAGVHDSPADHQVLGEFRNGENTLADCQARGRRVTSNPAVGERPRTSDIWLEVHLPDGRPAYATLTYGAIDQAALARLPQCTNVP